MLCFIDSMYSLSIVAFIPAIMVCPPTATLNRFTRVLGEVSTAGSGGGIPDARCAHLHLLLRSFPCGQYSCPGGEIIIFCGLSALDDPAVHCVPPVCCFCVMKLWCWLQVGRRSGRSCMLFFGIASLFASAGMRCAIAIASVFPVSPDSMPQYAGGAALVQHLTRLLTNTLTHAPLRTSAV